MKVLLLDIETAPATAYIWGLFDQRIPLDRIIDSGKTLCWAAKWLGEDEIMFGSIHKSSPKAMLRRIHKLLDEADAIIHYNGKRYDIPILNRDFLKYNLSPPSPYKQIDLLETMKSKFRFISNKLDYITRTLELETKIKHSGFKLWVDCMAGVDAAWEEMEKYNRGDITALESLYVKLLPWIPRHPNWALYTDSPELVCPRCGTAGSLVRRGYATTTVGRYHRYRCSCCEGWSQGRKNLLTPNKEQPWVKATE